MSTGSECPAAPQTVKGRVPESHGDLRRRNIWYPVLRVGLHDSTSPNNVCSVQTFTLANRKFSAFVLSSVRPWLHVK